MNIIIFEDEKYKNFLPLTWTRAVYDLRCGINTLAEKIVRCYPKAKVEFSCRYYIPGKKLMKLERGLFINGRVLADARLAKEIPLKGGDEVFLSGEEVAAIRAVSQDFKKVKDKAKVKKVRVKILKYPWELVHENGAQLSRDAAHFKRGRGYKADKSVVYHDRKQVIIDEEVEIGAHCVIDASEGPIYLGRGTIVRPLTYLKGPLSIGPVCRIGGEIGESIFHGYVNKQHYGFIGHSYIGAWVNLGAGTTNSDLKNNYSTVKVMMNGKKIDTQQKFVGCFIGDHAKTGIGTLVNTGTTIGVGANVLGGKVTGKNIPDFNWNDKERYRLDDFLTTAAVVMSRRGVKMSESEANLLAQVYKLVTAG